MPKKILLRLALYLATMAAMFVVLDAVFFILIALLKLSWAWAQPLSKMLGWLALVAVPLSLILLGLSRWQARRYYRMQIISRPLNSREDLLMQTVARLARTQGVNMPEVGIYTPRDDPDEVNAFATGCTRDMALVAVSHGLLNSLNQSQLEAVLAHEMSHVSGGDMVTLNLMLSVVNAFILQLTVLTLLFTWPLALVFTLLARLNLGSHIKRNPDGRGYQIPAAVYHKSWLAEQVSRFFRFLSRWLQPVFGFLGTLVYLWYSRRREYRADEGGARYCGREAMISALQVLGRRVPAEKNPAMRALCINGGTSFFFGLLNDHPSVEKRIAALRAL